MSEILTISKFEYDRLVGVEAEYFGFRAAVEAMAPHLRSGEVDFPVRDASQRHFEIRTFALDLAMRHRASSGWSAHEIVEHAAVFGDFLAGDAQ